MEVKIISLSIQNFKGIKDLNLSFSGGENFIYGQNGSGKTTIYDAFCWLISGKDSSDRADFEIKPIDKMGNRAQQTDSVVSASLSFDGEIVDIKKVYSEIWEIPTGQTEQKYKGNTALYFWDGVPKKMSEFNEKLEQFIPKHLVKVLSNVRYFNGSLKWNERRAILMGLVPEMSDLEMSGTDGMFKFINDFLLKKKTVEEYKSELAAKKKKVKQGMEDIPARIDEGKKYISSLKTGNDFEKTRSELVEKESFKQVLISSMASAQGKADAIREKVMQLSLKRNDLLYKINDESKKIELNYKAVYNNVLFKIKELSQARDVKIAEISHFESIVETNDKAIEKEKYLQLSRKKSAIEKAQELENLRGVWANISAEEAPIISAAEASCPTCLSPLKGDSLAKKMKEISDNWTAMKLTRLESVKQQAEVIAQYISESEKLNEDSDKKIQELKSRNLNAESARQKLLNELISIEEDINIANACNAEPSEGEIAEKILNDEGLIAIRAEINKLDKEIASAKAGESDSDLPEKISLLDVEIVNLRGELQKENLINSSNARIEELKTDFGLMAKELSEIERQEHAIKEFTFRKIKNVEDSINKLFAISSFRMFDVLVNGETKEVCDTLVAGKPIQGGAVNFASEINSGLDIINVLGGRYGLKLPVFIDSRESVTQIINSETQIINLCVSPDHKELSLIL